MNCKLCGKEISTWDPDLPRAHRSVEKDQYYCPDCCPMCTDGVIIPDERIDTLRHITGTKE